MTDIRDAPAYLVRRDYGEAAYGDWYWGGKPDNRPNFRVDVYTDQGWVDTHCDVRSIRIDRGRSTALDAWSAGTATLEYQDFDGRYSAWTPNSIWASGAKPNVDGDISIGPYRTSVPVRIGVTIGEWSGALFLGFTDAVFDSWPGAGADALVTVNLTDGFQHLARYKIPKGQMAPDNETSGARITRLARQAGFVGTIRADTGTVHLGPEDEGGVAIDTMDRTREAEWGALYVDGYGDLVFRQRDAPQTDPRMTTVQFAFEDTGLADCYTDLVLAADATQVANVATVQFTTGQSATASYADSIAWFGERNYTTAGELAFRTAQDAMDLAGLIVGTFSDNDRRVDGITFSPNSLHPDLWLTAAGVQILDRVRVIRNFPSGWQLDAELLVQGMHHEISGTGDEREPNWTVTLDTSTAVEQYENSGWDVGEWDDDRWGI